jgi:hypothetical protein
MQATPLSELQQGLRAFGLKLFTQNRRGEAKFWWVEHFIRGVREIPGGV